MDIKGAQALADRIKEQERRMAAKATFQKRWAKNTPEERRAKLNELGSRHDTLDEDGLREHDALAELVAKDEEEQENNGD